MIEYSNGNRDLREKGYELLINAITDYAIVTLDLEGNVVSWNAGAQHINQYAADEIIGQSFSVFFSAADRKARVPNKALETASSKGRFEAVGWRIRKDGSRFRANVVIAAIQNEAGQLLGFAKITRDITAQRNAHRHSEHSRSARVQSQKRKALDESDLQISRLQSDFAHLARVNDLGEMVGAISHEINQPLTAITNYFGAALHLTDGTQAVDNLAAARSAMLKGAKQAVRAGAIIRGLREFVGKANGTRIVAHPDTLVRQAITVGFIGGKAKGISMRRMLSCADAKIEVNAVQIEQVIVNLIRNGVEAVSNNPPSVKPQVRITTRDFPNLGVVEFCVSDNGPGIDPKLRSRLFKPFVTSKRDGMGIGLSVSRRIIVAHGGSIEFVDRKGRGSMFKFRLPRFISG